MMSDNTTQRDEHNPADVSHQHNTDTELDQALRQWHQHSKRQHRLTGPARRKLQQLVEPAETPLDWQRNIQQVVALAACLLVLVVWLTPADLLYQIEQQQQGLYTIQIHQLVDTTKTGQPQPVVTLPTASEQRATQYQLIYQDYLRSQQQAARTVAVWRQATANGWQLQSCEHLQVQVQADLLAALRRHQADQQLWQQLEQSRYLMLTTGSQGQILAFKPATAPPQCPI